MRSWWVNQNQTYKHEVPGGYLWSPKTKNNGGRNYFYDTMTQVAPGDLIFSFCDTYIKAVGTVQQPAVTSPKPDFQNAGANWLNTGWFVEVEFMEIQHPIAPKNHMAQIEPLLAHKYAPLRKNGAGQQGLYLTEISGDLSNLLLGLSGITQDLVWNELAPPVVDREIESAIDQTLARMLDGDLESMQLTKARRGQGLFKANVRLIERGCRVTGLTKVRHLRASHIKPWKISNNEEKLDGANGLLLSPHIDHLFDQGFISFENHGRLLLSTDLDQNVLDRWNILRDFQTDAFTSTQSKYLEYHRDVVFR